MRSPTKSIGRRDGAQAHGNIPTRACSLLRQEPRAGTAASGRQAAAPSTVEARRAASSARIAAGCPSRPRSARSSTIRCSPSVLAIVLQMAPQARLARRTLRRLGLHLRRQLLLHHDVRLDALGLDRAARRRVVPRGRQADGAVGAQRDDGLHRPLAERPCADHRRPPVILQCTRDDLRSRRRPAVHEHHDGLAVSEVARPALARCVSSRRRPLVSTIAPLSRKSSVTEIAWSSNPPGLLLKSRTKPARRFAKRLLQRFDLLHQVGVRLLVERRNLHVDDVAFESRPDRVDADHVANDLDVERVVLAAADDGER